MLKIGIMCLTLAAIAMHFLTGVSTAHQWFIEVVDGYGGDSSSIVLDSQDHPHISYINYDGEARHLAYAYWPGDYWHKETVDSSMYQCWFSSIDLDSQEYPHISYVDYDNSTLKYAWWTGSAWEIETVADVGVDYSANMDTSLKIDSQNIAHIAYYNANTTALMYASKGESGWEIETVDYVDDVGQYCSLDLDSQDYPHISYFDARQRDLRYAHFTGTEWDLQVVDSEGDVGYYTSIGIDSYDLPHISYHDYTNNNLKYAHWTGSEWDIQVVEYDGGPGWHTSIDIDSIDRPHISYFNPHNTSLRYAYLTEGEWDIKIVEYLDWTGSETSIAMDSQNLPHISYDTLESDEVLKYARYGDPYYDVELIYFSANSYGDSISLRWQVETTEGEQLLGFNLYRREIAPTEKSDLTKSNSDQNWQSVNNQLITGQNPYAYIDSNVASGISYEYRLEAVLTDQTKSTMGTCQGTAGLPDSFAITKVYPNPADDYLTCVLSVPQAGETDLALYDLTGRLVEKKSISEGVTGEEDVLIDVGNLSEGVYILQAEHLGIMDFSKIVIAR